MNAWTKTGQEFFRCNLPGPLPASWLIHDCTEGMSVVQIPPGQPRAFILLCCKHMGKYARVANGGLEVTGLPSAPADGSHTLLLNLFMG